MKLRVATGDVSLECPSPLASTPIDNQAEGAKGECKKYQRGEVDVSFFSSSFQYIVLLFLRSNHALYIANIKCNHLRVCATI